ncbi:hypothetical protein Tco_1169557, partial [Tanacetum coccineum]
VTLLQQKATLDKIREAVWDCGNGKSPGTDGFSFLFLKTYWDLFKDDIISFVKNFMDSGTMLKVDGSPTPKFSLERGLHQEYPLSPFLFLLVMEGLHLTLEEDMHTKRIKGVTLGNPSINLSHFFFANEVIILSDWDADNIKYSIPFFIETHRKRKIWTLERKDTGIGQIKVKKLC